jgi:hypothetical protein
MNFRLLGILPTVSVAILAGTVVVAQAQTVARGTTPGTGSIDVACTDTGLTNRAPLAEASYPARMEFVGGYGQPMGSGIITVSHADGRDAATVSCASPRILMRLPAGRYMATADMADGPTRTVDFQIRPHGRKTFVIRFFSVMAGAPLGLSPSKSQ